MTAKEIYERESGNKCPTNQIAYHEWSIEYMKWLENICVKNTLVTTNITVEYRGVVLDVSGVHLKGDKDAIFLGSSDSFKINEVKIGMFSNVYSILENNQKDELERLCILSIHHNKSTS
jgi:hypothetical protein